MYAQKKNFRGHLENATHIPLQELNERINELEQFKGKKLSFTVAPVTEVKRYVNFTDKGFHAVNMEGGIKQWNGKSYNKNNFNSPPIYL